MKILCGDEMTPKTADVVESRVPLFPAFTLGTDCPLAANIGILPDGGFGGAHPPKHKVEEGPVLWPVDAFQTASHFMDSKPLASITYWENFRGYLHRTNAILIVSTGSSRTEI